MRKFDIEKKIINYAKICTKFSHCFLVVECNGIIHQCLFCNKYNKKQANETTFKI